MTRSIDAPKSNLSQTSEIHSEDAPFAKDQPHPRFARKSIVSQWIPEVDPDHPQAVTFRTWRSRRQIVLWTATTTSFAVFLVNLVTTVVFYHKFPPFPGSNGIGTIFEGSQSQATRLSSGIHILINLLSTLLLGASNMCMQLCVAPTRKELDCAHAQSRWLDIGAPSLKNIKWIHPSRIPLVAVLALTSIPLHFLYNSAVFPSLVSNTYEWILVSPGYFEQNAYQNFNGTLDFINSIPDSAAFPGTAKPAYWQEYWTDLIYNQTRNNTEQFHRVSNLECLIQYNNVFGDRSDVILVTKNQSLNAADPANTLLWAGNWGAAYVYDPAQWLIYWGFNGTEHLTDFQFVGGANSAYFGDLNSFKGNTRREKLANRRIVAENWQIWGYTVDYCLMKERNSNKYTVSYSISIMIVICVANFCKCLGILATAVWYLRHKDPPLSILGDAIASFLESPDDTTRRLGACSLCDIVRRENIDSHSKTTDLTRRWRYPPPPLKWDQKNYRWFHGASKSRWAVTMTLCMFVLFTSFGFLLSATTSVASAITERNPSLSDKVAYVYSGGFGKPNTNYLVSWLGWDSNAATLYKHVFFANSWQFAISFLYLLINALVTSLLVGDEWARYGRRRKPLRVSAPKGIQRSSFFISMPYKYGAPLMISTSLLHWTVSQAVFVIKISGYWSNGEPDTFASVSAVGFSPGAITASVALGLAIIIGVCSLASKKYSRGMPLASTCSAAISAACHPPEEDYDAQYFPVMWGVAETNARGFVHCSFTTAKDARPLGERDDWSEEKEAHGKEDLKARKEQAKKARKEAKKEKASLSDYSIESSEESQEDEIEVLKLRQKKPLKASWSRNWRSVTNSIGRLDFWSKKKYEDPIKEQQLEQPEIREDTVAAWPASKPF